MGFSGSATKVLISNRALLKKKRSFKELKNSYIGYVNDVDLKFKELTPFEQQKIRDKIIAQAKRDSIHNIKMGLVSFLILILVLFVIYKLF